MQYSSRHKKDWRCKNCGQLLARMSRRHLRIRGSSIHDYTFTFPEEIVCICKGCRTRNTVRPAQSRRGSSALSKP